ncbi:hypothetical protein R6Q59_001779 [Mikania micrantha]
MIIETLLMVVAIVPRNEDGSSVRNPNKSFLDALLNTNRYHQQGNSKNGGPNMSWHTNSNSSFSIGLNPAETKNQPNKSRKRPRRYCSPEACSPTITGFNIQTPSMISFPDLNKSLPSMTSLEKNTGSHFNQAMDVNSNAYGRNDEAEDACNFNMHQSVQMEEGERSIESSTDNIADEVNKTIEVGNALGIQLGTFNAQVRTIILGEGDSQGIQ